MQRNSQYTVFKYTKKTNIPINERSNPNYRSIESIERERKTNWKQLKTNKQNKLEVKCKQCVQNIYNKIKKTFNILSPKTFGLCLCAYWNCTLEVSICVSKFFCFYSQFNKTTTKIVASYLYMDWYGQQSTTVHCSLCKVVTTQKWTEQLLWVKDTKVFLFTRQNQLFGLFSQLDVKM